MQMIIIVALIMVNLGCEFFLSNLQVYTFHIPLKKIATIVTKKPQPQNLQVRKGMIKASSVGAVTKHKVRKERKSSILHTLLPIL